MDKPWFWRKGLGGNAVPEAIFSMPLEEKGKPWDGEKLYFRGDDYYRDLLQAIDRSVKSVYFETYIFEAGLLGNKIITALLKAARRGVKVRLLVDGIGSPDFASHYGPVLEKGKIQFRVYRPWLSIFSPYFFRFGLIRGIGQFLRFLLYGMNRRDHRKFCLVDGDKIWLGSYNVSDLVLESVSGKEAWRETGVRLLKVRSQIFTLAFLAAWEEKNWLRLRRVYRRLLIQWLSRNVLESPIRVNVTGSMARIFHQELLRSFHTARKRVWITTPYFIPPRSVVKALTEASRAGCEVRLILPGHSDVPIVRWASMTFYPRLLNAHCRIFEYPQRVLHAKTLIVDSQGRVGSSNMNHRSFLHDLEINVILQEKDSLLSLEKQFRRDQLQSKEMTLEDLRRRPLWIRILSWLFFQFRYWL